MRVASTGTVASSVTLRPCLRCRSSASRRRCGASTVVLAAISSDPSAPTEEVSIRRRRPSGNAKLDCGKNFDFKLEAIDASGEYVDNEENKPRNILEEIVWFKDEEVSAWKESQPLGQLKRLADAAPPPRDFVAALRAMQSRVALPGLIAEVKKASPRCADHAPPCRCVNLLSRTLPPHVQ
jgi:Indole-3-glycerol phosphate synthase